MDKKETTIEDKVNLLIAVRNYKCEKKENWSKGIDFIASNENSDEKVFVRLIKPRKKSGFIGVDDVKNMAEKMRSKGCDVGILVGEKFTSTATQELKTFGIQKVSDNYMPPINSENVLLTINDCINNLCKARCGAVPLKESDCKNRLGDNFCRVRSISDDASFHFERNWMNLMKNDLKQLLSLNKTIEAW